jgi:hypothetical protein
MVARHEKWIAMTRALEIAPKTFNRDYSTTTISSSTAEQNRNEKDKNMAH